MAGKTVEEIFDGRLTNAKLFEVSTFASVALINDSKGHYVVKDLPSPAQWTPVFAFACADYNKDNAADFVAGGNFYGTMPYEGRYDALSLQLYTGDGKGNFKTTFPLEPALENINGEIRDIKSIRLANGNKAMLIAVNNSALKLLQY